MPLLVAVSLESASRRLLVEPSILSNFATSGALRLTRVIVIFYFFVRSTGCICVSRDWRNLLRSLVRAMYHCDITISLVGNQNQLLQERNISDLIVSLVAFYSFVCSSGTLSVGTNFLGSTPVVDPDLSFLLIDQQTYFLPSQCPLNA